MVSECAPQMSAERTAQWRKDAPAVLLSAAQVLDANGWSPQTAERCINSLVGYFTTMPLLVAAHDTLVAASVITAMVASVTPDAALMCVRAGLRASEVRDLLAAGPLDLDMLAVMAALRTDDAGAAGSKSGITIGA